MEECTIPPLKSKIRMKKIIILMLIIFNVYNCKAQDSTLNQIRNELNHFIDTVKPLSIKNGKYNVYIIKSVNNCLSICFIDSETSLDHISTKKYYFLNKNEIVMLIVDDDENIKKYSSYFDVKMISDDSMNIIRSKLFPKSKGAISGISKGLLICFVQGKMKRVFYENSEQMPIEFKYFDIAPSKVKIEKVYQSN
jgi:hypothetical protein